MSYEISLASLLSNRSSELNGRLSQIRSSAEPLLSYVHVKFPYYTPHGFSHSTGVEENLNWLVPDKIKEEMNEHEIFFLIIAAWLHDWGMIAEDGEDEEKIREEHHIRTETNFEKRYTNLNLSEPEARIIGRICKGHRKVDLNTEEYDDVIYGQGIKIRVKFLAALLRIADECDITHNRTPEVIYYSINPKGESDVEFQKHLSITGVGQLEEKHKIYISAIARDPRGAKTLREVEEKIQGELNKVKNILAQNGVTLDMVELRLETRGFIDKPIGFEVDRTKIVELLIGDHLYHRQDVAIRELVQNSIDSCKLKEALGPNYSSKIALQRNSDNTIVIEDNGMGMEYYEAKRFLSNVGSSFYNSELFLEEWGEKGYYPISQFGIGILSCFLICDRLTIETLKEGHESCRFSIESVNEEWKYEKGSRETSGTTIILELNKDGQAIKLEESLKRYFLCPEISIEYKDLDNVIKTFEPVWSADKIYERFAEFDYGEKEIQQEEILNLNMPDYDLILSRNISGYCDTSIIFNHGIYVGQFDIAGIDYRYHLLINLKRNILDIHISRESVKENEKLFNFIYTVINDIFRSIYERFGSSTPMKIISFVRQIVEDRMTFEADSETELLEKCPFIRSFIEQAPFIVLSNGEVSVVKWGQVLDNKELTVYNSCNGSLMDEIKFINKFLSIDSLFINAYKLPDVRGKNKPEKRGTLLEFILNERGIRYTELDMGSILLSHAVEVDVSYPELIPDNIRFATFGRGLQPLVVIRENPVVQGQNFVMGKSYWCNILLWQQLLDKERAKIYLKAIREGYDNRFEKIEIIKEPGVYIDLSDAFIKSVFEEREKGEFDKNVSKNIRRYLKYLSYLPLALYNMESCLIFLEAIDRLEEDIAVSLQIEHPLPLFQRMKPSSKVFLEYFRKFGIDYIER